MRAVIVLLLLSLAGLVFSQDLGSVAYVRVAINESGYANISSVIVTYGEYATQKSSAGEYSLQVRYGDSAVYSTYFNKTGSLIFSDSPGGGSTEEACCDYEFYVPFYNASQIIEVRHGDALVLSASLGAYLCDYDSICDGNEDYLTCPSDCPSGHEDGLCDHARDGLCDPDCFAQYDMDCICGDGACEQTYGEDFTTCCQDCGCPEGTGTVCGQNGGCRPPGTVEEYISTNPENGTTPSVNTVNITSGLSKDNKTGERPPDEDGNTVLFYTLAFAVAFVIFLSWYVHNKICKRY